MPVRTRNASGRFEPVTPTPNSTPEDDDLNINIPKSIIYKIILILAMLILLSPWLFLMIRKNSISSISQKVTDFYDDNFSCNSRSIVDEVEKKNTSVRKEENPAF